jgi:transcriptional regulator with XRE-family HTH domain
MKSNCGFEDAMLRQRIGARVFYLRRERKITALALADRARLHRNTVYRIEAGLSLCSVGQIWRIAEALGVNIEDFLRDSPSLVHSAINHEKAC